MNHRKTTTIMFAALQRFVALALLTSAVHGAEPALKLATFRADITPPLGEGACIGFMPKITVIEHPLEARGVVLRHGDQTFAIVALDYAGLCNSSDDLFRHRLAAAVGTTADRVAVQSLHQHTAPALDGDAARLLYAKDDPCLMAHLKIGEEMSHRVAQAAKAALARLQLVTRVVGTKAKVDRVASNRRVPQPDGSLVTRYSATRDAALQAAPEGLVDPWLRTVTFFNADKPLAQLHYYATHPQSFYGDARVSWDVPGIARDQLERETGVFQIYFTGCGGNIGMGKYNSGTRDARAALAGRLLDAMRQAAKQGSDSGGVAVNVARLSTDSLKWSKAPLRFTPREDGEFRAEALRAQLSPELPFQSRLKAAMCLAWNDRLRAGHAITLSSLTIGPLQLVHLPGEPFVEFQLYAQELAPKSFVCVAGYGECGVWYYGPDSIFSDKGGYEQSWSFTGPCQRSVETVLSTLMKGKPAP